MSRRGRGARTAAGDGLVIIWKVVVVVELDDYYVVGMW